MDVCSLWNIKPDDLLEVKTWFQEQKHLPQNTPDEYIIMMLYSCYSDVERTKKALETYFNIKSSVPELFSGRSLDRVQRALKAMPVMILESLTEEGNIVLWARQRDVPLSEFEPEENTKYLAMVLDVATREFPGYSGILFVQDAYNFSFKHLFKFSFHVIRKYLEYIQDASPVRAKNTHVINAGYAISKMLALAMPFIRTEYRGMVSVDAGMDLDHFVETTKIGLDLIPEEYGGNGQSVDKLTEETVQKVAKYSDWFKFDETLRVTKTSKK